MSQENVEAARAASRPTCAATTRRRCEYLAPDVVWEVGQELPARGPDEVREVWRRWDADWEELETVADEIIDAGDRLVVAVRYRGRGRVSGVEVNDLIFEVHTLRDGRCIRKIEFPTREQALAEVGLPG